MLLSFRIKMRLSSRIYSIFAVSPDLSFNERANTRGNNYELHNQSFHYDLQK